MIQFKPYNETDVGLILRWFNKPHVQKFYSLKNWNLEEVHQKMAANRAKGIKIFIIYWDENPVGYIQSYAVKDHLWDNVELSDDMTNSAGGIDLFIGEESYLGKGLGVKIMNQFLEEHIWPYYQYCFADPDINNEPSIALFQKCGFKKIKEIKTKDALKHPVTLVLMYAYHR